VGAGDSVIEPTVESPRWWDFVVSSPVRRQVVTICLTGAAVQGLLWFRGDSAAHVIGGAALATFLGVTAPQGCLRRLDAWAELVLIGVVLGVGWVAEMTVTGPFDIVDLAFTMGGAFVAVAALPDWIRASRRERFRLDVATVVLAATALALRYLSGLGKA